MTNRPDSDDSARTVDRCESNAAGVEAGPARQGEPGSITRFVHGVRDGDVEALRRLLGRCTDEFLDMARRQLKGQRCRFPMSDHEDIVQCALYKFFVGAQRGQFPRLENRDQFWRVMSDLIFKLVQDYLRQQTADKRGKGRVQSAGVFDHSDSNALWFDQITAGECLAKSPAETPLEELSWVDTLQFLLNALPPDLREIAQLKLAGHSNARTGAAVGCTEANIRYKLKQIYNKWQIVWRQSVDPQDEAES